MLASCVDHFVTAYHRHNGWFASKSKCPEKKTWYIIRNSHDFRMIRELNHLAHAEVGLLTPIPRYVNLYRLSTSYDLLLHTCYLALWSRSVWVWRWVVRGPWGILPRLPFATTSMLRFLGLFSKSPCGGESSGSKKRLKEPLLICNRFDGQIPSATLTLTPSECQVL